MDHGKTKNSNRDQQNYKRNETADLGIFRQLGCWIIKCKWLGWWRKSLVPKTMEYGFKYDRRL